MTLIEALRETVGAALAAADLPEVIYATYTGSGLLVDAALPEIPLERVDIPPMLRDGLEADCTPVSGGQTSKMLIKSALEPGEPVAALRHRGGQRYSVLYRL